MKRYLLAMMLVVAVQTANAQGTATTPRGSSLEASNPYTNAAGTPTTSPKPYTVNSNGGYSSSTGDGSPVVVNRKADCLGEAARYLSMAGLGEDAKKHYQMEAEERAHPTQCIVTKIRILELSRNKLAKLSSQPYGGDKNTSLLALLVKLQVSAKKVDSSTLTASADQELAFFIEALCKDHLITIVSDSEETRLPGAIVSLRPRNEPGFFVTSGEVNGHVHYGDDYLKFLEDDIRIDLIPTILSGGRVHFDLRVDRNELDYVNSTQGDPAIRLINSETRFDVRRGQTTVLDCGIQRQMFASDTALQASARKLSPGIVPRPVHRDVEEIETLLVLSADLWRSRNESVSEKPPAS